MIVSAAAFAILSRNTVFAGKKLALSSKNLEIKEGSYKTLKLDGAGKKARWSIKKGKDITKKLEVSEYTAIKKEMQRYRQNLKARLIHVM